MARTLFNANNISDCSLFYTSDLGGTLSIAGPIYFPWSFDPVLYGLGPLDLNGTYSFECIGCTYVVRIDNYLAPGITPSLTPTNTPTPTPTPTLSLTPTNTITPTVTPTNTKTPTPTPTSNLVTISIVGYFTEGSIQVEYVANASRVLDVDTQISFVNTLGSLSGPSYSITGNVLLLAGQTTSTSNFIIPGTYSDLNNNFNFPSIYQNLWGPSSYVYQITTGCEFAILPSTTPTPTITVTHTPSNTPTLTPT
jgi:hypothetical protein